MKVELEIYSLGGLYVEVTAVAKLYDYGAVSWGYEYEGGPLEMEIIEGPDFVEITLTDEQGNPWNTSEEILEEVEDLFYDWWYEAKLENRL